MITFILGAFAGAATAIIAAIVTVYLIGLPPMALRRHWRLYGDHALDRCPNLVVAREVLEAKAGEAGA